MKKIFAAVLSLILIFVFAGCGQSALSLPTPIISHFSHGTINGPAFCAKALNKDLSASKNRLPVGRIDTADEFEQFKKTAYILDEDWDDIPSFNDETAIYDGAFFEENSLLLVYITTGSTSYRFALGEVVLEDKSLLIKITETAKPQVFEEMIGNWFIIIPMADNFLQRCEEIDAVIDNANAAYSIDSVVYYDN